MSIVARFGPAPAVLGLLAVGGLGLLGLRNAWWTTTVVQAGVPEVDVSVSGAAVVPGAVGLALVVMASALGVLAGAARVRRLVGVLTVLIGGVGAGWVLTVSGAAAQASALDAAAVSGAVAQWSGTWWRAVTGLGFVLALLLGVYVLAGAGRWAVMGARYESGRRPRADVDLDPWAALDDGIDPTSDEAQ